MTDFGEQVSKDMWEARGTMIVWFHISYINVFFVWFFFLYNSLLLHGKEGSALLSPLLWIQTSLLGGKNSMQSE